MAVFVTRLIQPIVTGTNAGDIDVGTEVILNENGQPVNYLIVNQGIPENSALYDASCEGTWLLRKDIRELGAWNASGVNTLPGSTIMTTMAGYLDDFDANVQESIKTVKMPYCVGNGSATVNSGANGLSCKIFLLSGREVGLTNNENSYLPNDGAKLDYFISGNTSSAKQRRVANLNGNATGWWFRSPYIAGTDVVWGVPSTGSYGYWDANDSVGIRPTLILPYEFKFQDDQISA